MSLYVDPIEALWIVMNATAAMLTTGSFIQALRDWRYVNRLNGGNAARKLTAAGNVRREFLRGVVQFLLLALVLPGLLVDRPVPLTPFVIAFITIPLLLLIQTFLDMRDRIILNHLLVGVIQSEFALESSVQEAISAAREAFHEANSVNQKIATLTELVGHKEDRTG